MIIKKKLWIFSFEYSGIKKVGGLGEVPANQTKSLSKNYDITLFIPSHGVHHEKQVVEKLGLQESEISGEISINRNSMLLRSADEKNVLSFMVGSINGIKVVIIKGVDKYSASILNDPIVYSPKTLTGKIQLFSLGIKSYIQHLIENNPEDLPDIVHCHDYHPIPSLIVLKQVLMEKNFKVASVFTIHLLTYPRYPIDFLWSCGISDTEIIIFIGDEYKKLTISELYKYCRGANLSTIPSLEKVGAFFSDIVTSVSEDYLRSEIVPILGGGWINSKSEFVWNGCDWNYKENLKQVLDIFQDELKLLDLPNWQKRTNLRKFLLTKGLDLIPEHEPIVESENIEKFISENLVKFPYKPNKNGVYTGHVYPFSNDGTLIITTGRLSKQKGIDILINSIPKIIESFPNVRFILFLMPTEFSIHEIKEYFDLSQQYPDNIRILFGSINSIFKLVYLSADIYCIPSRWEPFGIIALEAMISKIPVVASKIGGLQESIIDLKDNIKSGTGLLVPPENSLLLSQALIDMISILKIDEINKNDQNMNSNFSKISDKISNNILREMVIEDPSFGSKIRENCIKRVENNFRWKKVSKKLIEIYTKALNVSKAA